MERQSDISISTYSYRNGFMVDIVDNNKEETLEAWLYNTDCDIKDLMFRLPKHQEATGTNMTLDEFMEQVEGRIEDQNYIDIYEDWYMN
ncbi:MAG: hypothetical protein K5750_06890 [Eubacterium sp.]|nr:hypothetical protein [Eubacterium sp.]